MKWNVKVSLIALAATGPLVGYAPFVAAQNTVLSDSAAIESFATTLRDSSASPSAREEAARKILARNGPVARDILLRTLGNSGDRNGQLGVAKALGGEVAPDDAYINPLLNLLGPDRILTEAVAQALGQYKGNPFVLNELIRYTESLKWSDANRTRVIAVVGTFSDKRAVQALISLLLKPDESDEITRAAANALVELTGLRENGRDVQRWQQYWQANANKPDDQWRLDLLRNRAARFDTLQKNYAELVKELSAVWGEQYRVAANREEFVLRLMKSSRPELRVVAANLIVDDFEAGRPIPPPVAERLRILLGDNDTSVRQRMADVLQKINDPGALDALMKQFKEERDPDTRQKLAAALGKTKNIKAAPLLLTMLDDESFAIVRSGALALDEMGDAIQKEDPALAQKVSDKLEATVKQRPKMGSEEMREACLQAMVKLKDARKLQFFYGQLLDPNTNIRVKTLQALGELRLEQSADQIIGVLNDREARVRRAAVDALYFVATFANADSLFQRLNPNNEPDAAIREAVWQVLVKLFDGANEQQLANWAQRFMQQPARRVVILKALAKKLQTAKNQPEQLAYTEQNVGEALMKLDPPQATEAATVFGSALKYWVDQNNQMNVATLINQRLEALLVSRQYPEAAKFAAETIAMNPSHMQAMGSRIRGEAEKLRNAGDSKNAIALIDEAIKMNPPLASNYVDTLQRIREEVDRRGSK